MGRLSRQTTISLGLVAAILTAAFAAGCGDVVQQAQDQADQVKQDVTQATSGQVTGYLQGVSDPMQSVVKARGDLAAAEARGQVSEAQMRQFSTRVAAAANDLKAAKAPPGIGELQQQLATDLSQWSQTAATQAAAGLPGAQQVLGATPEIGGWADALSMLCQAAGVEKPAWLTTAQQLDQLSK